jgi:hypothetical protein
VDPKFKILNISSGTMLVSTKGLYRVVYHNGIERYVNHGLRKAKDAIYMASICNSLQDCRRDEMWA